MEARTSERRGARRTPRGGKDCLMTRRWTVASFAVAAFAIAATPAAAKNLTVGQAGDQKCKSDFTTIQAAVDAASPGDHIKVCAGTYAEHVVIGAGKDNLDIQGHNPNDTFIQFPPALPAPGNADAVVLVNGAQNLDLQHFTIQGPYSDD